MTEEDKEHMPDWVLALNIIDTFRRGDISEDTARRKLSEVDYELVIDDSGIYSRPLEEEEDDDE